MKSVSAQLTSSSFPTLKPSAGMLANTSWISSEVGIESSPPCSAPTKLLGMRATLLMRSVSHNRPSRESQTPGCLFGSWGQSSEHSLPLLDKEGGKGLQEWPSLSYSSFCGVAALLPAVKNRQKHLIDSTSLHIREKASL